jgi:glycerol-3-phosphate acyltransferase PlsY
MDFVLFGLIAYLLGSIPTAVWVGKSYYGIDVRAHGSKNAGATNTFRVLGKKPGIVVLLIDVLKGATAVLLPYLFLHDTIEYERLIQIQLLTAILAILGHVFPLFANFKGGKGVATSLGIIIGIHPPAAGICLAVFLLVFILSKYVSLGAIITAISFPLLIIFLFHVESIWLRGFSILLGSVVVLTHKKNILRLVKGEESKMNLFKK